jgi:hypothetical protein
VRIGCLPLRPSVLCGSPGRVSHRMEPAKRVRIRSGRVHPLRQPPRPAVGLPGSA